MAAKRRCPRLQIQPLSSPTALSFFLRSLLLLLPCFLLLLLLLSSLHSLSRYSHFRVDRTEAIREAHRSKIEDARLALQTIFKQNVATSRHEKVWEDQERSHHPFPSNSLQINHGALPLELDSRADEWTPHSRYTEDKLRRYTSELCIVITTIPRQQQYFFQTLASLLHALSPQLQQATNIYILNGNIPHTGHADVMWLERELQRLRRDVSPSLWRNLHVLHVDERRKNRHEQLAKDFAGQNDPVYMKSIFYKYQPHLSPWVWKESMDYIEALDVCQQHHTLQRKFNAEQVSAEAANSNNEPASSFNRTLMYGVEGDWVYELMKNESAATSDVMIPPRRELQRMLFPSVHHSRSSSSSNKDSSLIPPPPLCLILEDDVRVTHDVLRKLYQGLRPLWDENNSGSSEEDPFKFSSGEETILGNYLDTDPLPDDWVSRFYYSWVEPLVMSSSYTTAFRRSHPEHVHDESHHHHLYAFIRLFLTDYWDGWERLDYVSILPLLGMSFSVVITLFCLVADWLRRSFTSVWRRSRHHARRGKDFVVVDEEAEIGMSPPSTSRRSPSPTTKLLSSVAQMHRSSGGDEEEESLELLPLPRLLTTNGVNDASTPPSPMNPTGGVAHARLASQSPPSSPTNASTVPLVSGGSSSSLPIATSNSAPFSCTQFIKQLFVTPFLPPAATKRSLRLGIMALFILFSLLVIVVLVLIGKQHLYFFGLFNAQHVQHGLHPLPKGAAGTLATVFPAPLLTRLMSFLRSHYESDATGNNYLTPIDVLLNQFAKYAEMTQFHLTPDCIQHTGVFSSSQFKNQGTFDTMKVSPSWRP